MPGSNVGSGRKTAVVTRTPFQIYQRYRVAPTTPEYQQLSLFGCLLVKCRPSSAIVLGHIVVGEWHPLFGAPNYGICQLVGCV